MGFLESMALLVALGGASYVTVYYVLPALQQMSMAPYYYMQAAAAAQQQQPAATPPPAQEPVTQDATLTDEALEPEPESETLEDVVQDAVEDELEDAGLVKDPPAEEKEEKKKSSKSSTPTSSKKEIEDFKSKRAESGKKATEKAKASGFKKTGPSPIGSGWVKYEFPTSIGIKVVIVDDYNIVRDQYYT